VGETGFPRRQRRTSGRQPGAALGAPRLDDPPAILGGHPCTESVVSRTA
jgi:hypothetical protein